MDKQPRRFNQHQHQTNTNTYSYGFPSAAPSYYTDADSIERDLGKAAGWQAFNAQQKAFTEQALAVVSAVADVTFVATDVHSINSTRLRSRPTVSGLPARSSPLPQRHSPRVTC